MRWPLAVVLIAACSGNPDGGDDDVVGPYTGPIHRYVVDGFRFPATSTESAELANDLDGDTDRDNQLGQITALLASYNDLTASAPDMIASGVLASTVEIQANDLVDDATVAVRYLGGDGEAATPAGGQLAAGVFRSNRTATTRVPGDAMAHLPIFIDIDPTVVRLVGMQIDLVPDGNGGFDGTVCGGIPAAAAAAAAQDGLLRMIEAHPQAHPFLARLFDRDRDGVITPAELAADTLIQSLVSADLELGSGDALSVCFAMHLAPCATGRCTGAPADPCHDRILDGDEVDLDCGGSCFLACPAGGACAGPGGCQTAGCIGNVCALATCSDGVRDGFESDVDCGANCSDCQLGERCFSDSDCATGNCSGFVQAGTCIPPG